MYFRFVLLFLLSIFLAAPSFGEDSSLAYSAKLDGFSGPETRIHDDFIPSDGSVWNDPAAITSTRGSSSLTISFREAASIKAIFIQADWNDVYVFEGTVDGSSYRPIWYAPITEGGGLQRRFIIFKEPVNLNLLKIRAARSDGMLSISELQLFSKIPSNWSELTKRSRSNNNFQWSSWLNIGRVEAIKESIAGIGMLLLFWYTLCPSPNKARNHLMLLVSLVAAAGWCNFFQFHFGSLVHRHEFFHYYLGSKYSPEIGYKRLYDCVSVADKEDSFLEPAESRLIRNLETNSIDAATRPIEHPEFCKSHFTQQRWESFKSDLVWFRENLSKDEYLKALKDHGYNATPIWNFNGYLLSNLSPATTNFIYALGLLDCLLLMLAFIFAGLTFGLPAMFASLLFFTSNFIASFAWTGGAFLRADWVVASIIGISFLKREKWRAGGAALAFAGLTRIFPFALLGGVFLREIVLLTKTRRLSSEFLKISQGAFLAVVLLVAISTIPSSGFNNWSEFIANTKKHFHTLSTNVVGLKIVAGFSFAERTYNLEDPSHNDPFDYWKQRWNERISDRKPLVLALQLSLLSLIIFSASKLPIWGASIMGIGLVLLINLSNYDYYVLSPFGLLASLYPTVGLLIGVLAWISWSIPSMVQAMDEIYFFASILVTLFVITTSLYISTSKSNQ